MKKYKMILTFNHSSDLISKAILANGKGLAFSINEKNKRIAFKFMKTIIKQYPKGINSVELAIEITKSNIPQEDLAEFTIYVGQLYAFSSYTREEALQQINNEFDRVSEATERAVVKSLELLDVRKPVPGYRELVANLVGLLMVGGVAFVKMKEEEGIPKEGYQKEFESIKEGLSPSKEENITPKSMKDLLTIFKNEYSTEKSIKN